MMNKKQKLKNAVILGLLMSSVTASSAWAGSLVVENIKNDNANLVDVTVGENDHYKFVSGVVGNYVFTKNIMGVPVFKEYNKSPYDSIQITVKNNYYSNPANLTCGDYAIGINDNIYTGVNLESKSGISIDVETRNAQNGYGIYNKNGNEIKLDAKDDIKIDVQKTKGIYAGGIINKNYRYDKSYVYGINSENGGVVKLNSKDGNITVDAYYDKEAVKKAEADEEENSEKLLKYGNIYGISNIKGEVNLSANNGVISIDANSHSGDANAIFTSSNEKTILSSKYNMIFATADGDGKAYGIYATNGAQVDITGDTYVSGDDGAIVVSGDGINTFGDGEQEKQFTVDGNLTAISSDGTAVSVEKGASMSVDGNGKVNYLSGKEGSLLVQGDVYYGSSTTFHTETNADYNIKVDGGNLTIAGDIDMQGGYKGLNIDGGSAYLGKEGADNYIYAGGKLPGDTNINNVARAVEIENGGSLTLTGAMNRVAAGDITVVADDRILADENIDLVYGSGYSYNIKGDADSDVTITGDNNIALGAIRVDSAADESAGGASFTMTGNNYIGSSTHGIDNEHLVSAVYTDQNGKVTLDATTAQGNKNIIVSDFDFVEDHDGDSERTVWAKEGVIEIKGTTIIKSSNAEHYYDGSGNATNSKGIAITAGGSNRDNTTGGNSNGDGCVNLEYSDGSKIYGDIVAGIHGTVNIKQYVADGVDNSKNGLYLEGNALAGNGGNLSLDLGNGGVWYGRADDYQDASKNTAHGGGDEVENSFYNPAFNNKIEEAGTVNITMGEGSEWHLTGQSWVTSLDVSNSNGDALIDMTHVDDKTHALTIKELIGSNNKDGAADVTFKMGLHHDNLAESDMIYIKNASGTYDVELESLTGVKNIDDLKDMRFATIKGDASFKNVYMTDNGLFDLSFYVASEDYNAEDTETNEKYNGEEFGENKPGNSNVEDFFKDESGTETMNMVETDNAAEDDSMEGVKNWYLSNVKSKDLSDAGKTVVNMSKVNYNNAIYMDRLNKRMGEARFIDGDEGIWVRMRHDRIGKDNEFRIMNTMYEVGYDAKQIKEDGEHRVGIAIDYMDGSSEYTGVGGSGDISRKGIWMYDTWMGEKGHYRDLVAKWGHLSNDFTLYRDGKEITGDYSNNVYSISAEFGKKNDIGNNWYFEPQVQLQYARLTDADYVTSQGTEVSLDAINSLIARAGFRLGKDLGERSTLYFKADVLHEFLGDQGIYAEDDTGSMDVTYGNEGTWCDVGFGFATAMSKTSYAYLDVETSLGNDYDETYQINAGLQWTF